MKVSVGVSNRHVHLTEEAYRKLFGDKAIEKKFDLNQIGEFASTDKVTIIYDLKSDKKIEGVRVVGPFREKNQIELLGSDLEYLGFSAPTRRSGELDETPIVILEVSGKRIVTDGVIRAERHVHVPTSRTHELGLYERDIVRLDTEDKSFYANVKVSDNGYFELHIDKDEALEYGLSNGDEVELSLYKRSDEPHGL